MATNMKKMLREAKVMVKVIEGNKVKAPKALKATTSPDIKAPKATPVSLTTKETKVLNVLASSPIPMTRAELTTRTGIKKGWSRLLGASTKEDGGVAGSKSLEAKGYVTNRKVEDERSIQYTITASGRKALDKAKKEAK